MHTYYARCHGLTNFNSALTFNPAIVLHMSQSHALWFFKLCLNVQIFSWAHYPLKLLLDISQQQNDHGGCCACTSQQQYNTSAVQLDQTSLESWYPVIIESTVKNSTSDTIVRIEHKNFPHTMKLLSGKTFTVSVQNSYLYENFCRKNFAVATHNANHKGHRLLYRVALTNP